ncbi:MAG: esterase/lipase family protein [Phycisphaerales bacterium JB043]
MRPLPTSIALIVSIALVVAGLNTILENGRTSLTLDHDGSRMVGVLVPKQKHPDDRITWERIDHDTTPDRLVVLVHGLDEPGTIWDDLTPILLDNAYDVARFEYHNDRSIAESAEFLAQHLRKLHDSGTTRVDLICHSMGGLVARDSLTRPTLYPQSASLYPRVERLITIGTPNHGSPLAPLQPISEVRELLVRWAISFGDAMPTGSTIGESQAALDLEPGSDFLVSLNARPMPADIRHTIIIGKLLPIDDDAARGVLNDPTLQALLTSPNRSVIHAQLSALVQGVGDGVVPLESALLEGVDDTLVLEANHRAMLKRSAFEHELNGDALAPAPAIPIILDRLSRDGALDEPPADDGAD